MLEVVTLWKMADLLLCNSLDSKKWNSLNQRFRCLKHLTDNWRKSKGHSQEQTLFQRLLWIDQRIFSVPFLAYSFAMDGFMPFSSIHYIFIRHRTDVTLNWFLTLDVSEALGVLSFFFDSSLAFLLVSIRAISLLESQSGLARLAHAR